jgi:methionyl aminopeptidase
VTGDNADRVQAERIEATGPDFSLGLLLEARTRTRRAVAAIGERIRSGMSEDEASAVARDTLSELGLRRGWHRIIVRCGPNTTKSFHESSADGVILGSDDLFFVDIGPVYQEYEGDAGDTFVLGDDPDHHRIRRDVRAIWEETRGQWLEHGSTGEELYRFAGGAAADRGWVLNLDLSGHRLSDFPHHVHFKGSMADVPHPLRPARWVLEIAIADPDGRFGAFYEDLLLVDQ